MVGHGELSDIESPLFPPEVKCFDLNPRDGCFGPEVGFARHFLDVVPGDELWLVKYAVGGSSLLAWKPEWSAERAAITGDEDKGALYPRLISHFKQVTRGTDVEVLACLWMQGEATADTRVAAADNMKRKLQRTYLSKCAATWISRRCIYHWLGERLQPDPFYLLKPCSRRSETPLKDCRNVYLVDTDGLTKHEDDLHYDSAGQLELGRRFAHRLSLDLLHKDIK